VFFAALEWRWHLPYGLTALCISLAARESFATLCTNRSLYISSGVLAPLFVRT
jgi:hypothetical protein